MAKRDFSIAKVLADNVRRLVIHAEKLPADAKAVRALERRAKLPPGGTATRILKGDSFARINTVDHIARKFGLRAYQLLIPDLDPADPARLPVTPQEKLVALGLRAAVVNMTDGEATHGTAEGSDSGGDGSAVDRAGAAARSRGTPKAAKKRKSKGSQEEAE